MRSKLRTGIVGGGVIGLSVAWELARRGHEVTLFENGQLGRKASWAGAGILAPANAATATQPMDKLLGLGTDLHHCWSSELKRKTGIENGFRKCGGLYLATSAGDRASLIGQCQYWNDYGIGYEKIKNPDKAFSDTDLSFEASDLAVHVDSEYQIRNPDHLRALVAACEIDGVELIPQCEDLRVEDFGARGVSIFAKGLVHRFDRVCFAAGAWTSQSLELMAVRLPMIPVRGQMLLFKLPKMPFEFILNLGSRYIVPRNDGFVLAGSTTEEVGFDESTTPDKVDELIAFASGLLPALGRQTLDRAWSGLRPATFDGFPYMGSLTGCRTIFVATGHFKAGLQMSPAVAVILADQMEGESSIMDATVFEPSRISVAAGFASDQTDIAAAVHSVRPVSAKAIEPTPESRGKNPIHTQRQ